WETREVDAKLTLPKITSAALLWSDLSKDNLISDKKEVFSRTGIWRGPLSGLPQSTFLELPSAAPPSETTLELVLLPEADGGDSLVLSFARAQLSVPLIRGYRYTLVRPADGAGGYAIGAAAASPPPPHLEVMRPRLSRRSWP
ncbi:unnamed protein product, partial [Ectocarpus sp. 4 AP-2014]